MVLLVQELLPSEEISVKTRVFFMDTDDYFWEQTDPPYTKKAKSFYQN